jgi:hypothetical protein
MEEIFSEKYASYIDKIYETGKSLFSNFPSTTYPVNIESIIDVLGRYECGEHFKEFLIKFYTNIEKERISFEIMKDIYDNNVNELDELMKTGKYELVLVTTNFQIIKSNFWLSMYIYGKLKSKGITIKYAISTIANLFSVKDISTRSNPLDERLEQYSKISERIGDKKILLLFCDDVLYSGSQIAGQISGWSVGLIKHNGTLDVSNHPKLSVYLCIVGATELAFNKVKNTWSDRDKIIMPNHIIKPKSINEILRMMEIDINNRKKISTDYDMLVIKKETIQEFPPIESYVIESLFNTMLGLDVTKNSLELTGTYLDMKYPDSLSTLPTLCKINISGNVEFLYDKLSEANKAKLDDKLKDQPFVIIDNDVLKNVLLIDEKDVELVLNDDFVLLEKKYNLIKRNCGTIPEKMSTIKNCKELDLYESCTKQECPPPFYKKINYDVLNLDIKKNLLDNFKLILHGGNYYAKYIKYKSKYQKLKKSLNYN